MCVSGNNARGGVVVSTGREGFLVIAFSKVRRGVHRVAVPSALSELAPGGEPARPAGQTAGTAAAGVQSGGLPPSGRPALEACPAEQLLAEFRASGSQPAFEELVRRYAALVFAECYAVTRRRHDAEDAAQATFLTLAVQARTGDDIRHLGAWLQRVARRVALDQEKARRRRHRREENHHRVNGYTGLATPHRESLDQLELRDQIHEELNRLPAKYRLPLVLHYYGGLSREQMAVELRCKPATLGVRLFRAREMLGKRLARRGITLPAAGLTLAASAVVRESVEQHGLLAMAASASQLAEAASRVAAGFSPVSTGVSASVLALAEAASHELVVRKVRAIIAAAAIGASAIAAGGATIVHKLVEGHLPPIVDFSQLFRSFTAPSFELRVEAAREHNGSRQPPTGWPSALTLLDDRGRLQLLRVRPQASEVSPAAVTWGSTPYPATASELTTFSLQPASGGRWAGPPAAARPVGPAVSTQSVPPASPTDTAPAASHGAIGSAASAAGSREGDATPLPPSAVLPLEDHPTSLAVLLASGGGAGGGGGGGVATPFTGTFSLAPVPPLTPARSVATRQGTTLFGPSASASGDGPTHASAPQQQLSASGDVLRGWGEPQLLGHFDNSGVVIADGFGRPRTLDLTRVASTFNAVPNPPTGVNGWYARDGGALSLPPMRVPTGTSQLTWGDDPNSDSLDLVNSLRLTLREVTRPGTVAISLLAPDRPEVPSPPGGYAPLSIWALTGLAELSPSGIDLVARYGLPGGDLAASLTGLSLFYLDGADWRLASAHLDPSRRLIFASDLPPTMLLGLFTVADRLASLLDPMRAITADPVLDQLIHPLANLQGLSETSALSPDDVVGWVSADDATWPAELGSTVGQLVAGAGRFEGRAGEAVLGNRSGVEPGSPSWGHLPWTGLLPGVVPEPTQLLWLAAGGLLLRRRPRRLGEA